MQTYHGQLGARDPLGPFEDPAFGALGLFRRITVTLSYLLRKFALLSNFISFLQFYWIFFEIPKIILDIFIF